MLETAAPPDPRGWHKKVLSLVGPMMMAGVTAPLVGLVDTAIAGRLPQPSYLGAVAVGATIFNVILWMLGFLRMSTTALSAQARGRGDAAGIAAIVYRAVAVAVALAALILSLQQPLFDLAFQLLEATPEVEALARSYCQVRIWGVPAALLNLVILGALFGLQHTRAVLLLGLVLNFVNVTLDLYFVLLLGWDVKGVAAGTVISEWLAAGLGIGLLWRRTCTAPAAESAWRTSLHRGQLRTLFNLSRDLILRSLLVQLPFFVFTLMGAGFGDTVLAANAVLMQLFFFMAFGLNSFAHVSETLVGNALGARDAPQLRSACAYTMFWSVAFGACISGTYLFAGEALIDLLTDLPPVRDTARQFLPWMIVMPLLAAGAFQLDGIYIGAARTRVLRNMMVVSVLGFAAVLWLVREALGNHGLWLALAMFMMLRAATLAAGYRAMMRGLT